MLMRIIFSIAVLIPASFASCAIKEFMPCVVQLNSQQVKFDTNIMHVVYNITTEAKLMHTCRVYERVMPCFSQRLAHCGTKAQKGLFDRGKRLHTYLCAPFSLQRQKIFLSKGQCIQKVISTAIDSKCMKPEGIMKQKLESCRSKCATDQFCHTKVDISELAACTYLKIEKECGVTAAQFYSQMQQVLSNREHPVQCSYNIRSSTPSVIPPTTTPVTSTAPSKTKTFNVKQTVEVRPVKNYQFSSYITMIPTDSTIRKNSISRAEPRFPSTTNNSKTAFFSPTKPIVIPALREPEPTSATTTPSAAKILYGARPIPDSPVSLSTATFAPNPYAKSAISPSPSKTSEIPWVSHYFKSKDVGSAPTNPMFAPFMDSLTTTVRPDATMKGLSQSADAKATLHPFRLVFQPPEKPVMPLKISINWMNDQETEPWYYKPQTTAETTTQTSQNHHEAPVHGGQSAVNFTKMGNQASNYFSAAINAFSSIMEESMNSADGNEPWKALIDAVAPTIQRVSPGVIPKLKQEFERFQNNTN